MPSTVRYPSSTESTQRRLAVFLATSGHSGVDRIMGNLLPAIAERGIRVDLLHVKNHGPYIESRGNLRIIELGTAHALSSLLPLVRYLKSERPDVLLSDKDRINRVSIAASKLSRVELKLFVRIGTTVSSNLESRKWYDRTTQKISMKYLYPMADGVLTPSKGAAEDFATYIGFDRAMLNAIPSPVVTPDLIEKSKIPITHPWFLDPKIPVIVGMGELCSRKDFVTLIRAFGIIRQSIEAKLFIMGKGRQHEKLEGMAADMGLKGEIEFPGFIENPCSYLSKADLYVHSSRWEGSPVALMEAAALGIPLVSTDCPSGPREILDDGRYGKLVPVGDHRAMSMAILETLKNPPDPEFIRKAAEPYLLKSSTSRYIDVLGLGQC